MLLRKKLLAWLIIGDMVCALIISLVGFITHYGQVQGWRWLTTFVPVCIGWLAIAPWLGVYQETYTHKPVHAWRAALAALLSAPLAASLRGAWLNSAILPLFVLVLGLTDALGFFLWRALWSGLILRIKRNG